MTKRKSLTKGVMINKGSSPVIQETMKSIFFFILFVVFLLAKILPARTLVEPLGTLTSNSITDIQISDDTVWVITSIGVNFTWDNGESWKGFTNKHGLGNGTPVAIINKYGRTFVSTYESVSGTDIPQGTGIAEYGNKEWNNKIFDWKDGNNVWKLGFDAVAFDSVFYFAYIGGALLKMDVRADTSWKIVVPDTSGLLPNDYVFSEFPPDTILNPDYPREFIVWSIVIDSIAPDSFHIYLGTANGLMTSTNSGLSWTHILPPKGLGRLVSGLWLQKSTELVIWASLETNGDTSVPNQQSKTVRSRNGGNSWQEVDILGGILPNAIVFTGKIAWIATEDGLIKMENDSIVKGTEDFRQNGLLSKKCRTIDAIIIPSDLPSDTILWVGTENGLYRSKNAGNTWEVFLLKKIISGGLKEVYAVPTVLRNNGPEETRIVYNLSSDANTTITIHDWNMYKVKTIIENQPRKAGASSASGRSNDFIIDRWDGTNNRGAKAAVGTYYFKVETDQGEKGFGKIIILR